jgi:hypothetical protein
MCNMRVWKQQESKPPKTSINKVHLTSFSGVTTTIDRLSLALSLVIVQLLVDQ